MFEPSRDQVREFFFEIWRKYRAGMPLAGLENLGLDVILLHPEYHAFLFDPDKNRTKDFDGESNPFLHLSLHLTLEEQLSIGWYGGPRKTKPRRMRGSIWTASGNGQASAE